MSQSPTSYKTRLREHIVHIQHNNQFPWDHIAYLQQLKSGGFEPRVIYDIGSCVLHWEKEARRLWPDATYVLFEANSDVEFLYDGYDYFIGVLGNKDNEPVRFYQNDFLLGGNSIYRELGFDGTGKHYPSDAYMMKTMRTLDSVVKEYGFPLPDLVKMDVQGAELDIVAGGAETLKHAQRMILELQHTNYNDGAPKANEVLPVLEKHGWNCCDPKFCESAVDADYGFIRETSVCPGK